MALNDEEKVQIRRHLGFLNVAEVFTFVLGTPAGVETQFIVEGAMHRLLLVAEPHVRQCLCDLAELERARQEAAINPANKVGNIEMEPALTMLKAIDDQLAHKRGELANAFGIYQNPFDKRQGRGINARVAH